MQIATKTLRGIQVVCVSGVVDRHATGRLTEALIESISQAGRLLIVDLSDVPLMSHAATRSLVIAAKLLESAHGKMRISGATGPVDALLRGRGFNHLLKLDASVDASVATLVPDRPARMVRDTLHMVRQRPEGVSTGDSEWHVSRPDASAVDTAA